MNVASAIWRLPGHRRMLPHRFLSHVAVPGPKVAIVGSGPAGFYTAKYLLDKHATLSVDILEALPTPFGLVRHGVAPDHPEVKSVMSTFTEVAEHHRCRFFGNVRVGGAQVPLENLQRAYDVVVLAYGAASDAALGVSGEDLPGVMSARAFVNWYNGHPAYRDLAVDLSITRRVVIIGQGNVAIDCARILAKRPDDLACTDIAPHALATLRRSAVEDIVVIGRRGHVQAAFTIKEIRELTKIDGCALHISEAELAAGKTTASDAEVTDNRPKLRIVELLAKIAADGGGGGAGAGAPPATKAVRLRFLLSPTDIVADNGAVAAINLSHNRLEGEAHRQRAVPTGTVERLPCQFVLKSVGYTSEPLAGAPFDGRTRTVPNVAGRVVERVTEGAPDLAPVPGLYVSGWLKRGPSGIIGTNITDAKETVMCILEDLRAAEGRPATSRPPLAALGAPEVVTWADYQRIDQEERARGEALAPPKPREKICSVGELLRVAKKQP